MQANNVGFRHNTAEHPCNTKAYHRRPYHNRVHVFLNQAVSVQHGALNDQMLQTDLHRQNDDDKGVEWDSAA